MIDRDVDRTTAPAAPRATASPSLVEVSIPRLYAYHRALRQAQTAGKTTITSHGLAALLGHTIASTQIRKDLSALGPLGRRGQGYAIDPLVEQLALVLGLEHDWRIAIVGFGYLGHAFAAFISAREARFRVAAIFDRSPAVIGQTWQGLAVQDVADIERGLAEADCNIGVIAVPAEEAPPIARRIAGLGVRAILNFAPIALDLHAPVIVRNIDLAGELSILTHRLSLDLLPRRRRVMPIVCVGLSHRTAPVDVRERHAFPASRMGEALVALRDYPAVREAAMLQTCGRLEIYAELDDYEAGVAQIKSFLMNFGHGATGYDIESYLYTLLGRQAVDHLLRVATGLDSMLIGEAEILGQVKDAYVQAQHAKSLGKILHRLFRDALNAGKTARAQTRIGEESGSIATAAVEAAKARFGSLEGKTIVVIGAGKMGRTAVKRLRLEGAVARDRDQSHDRPRARSGRSKPDIGEAIECPVSSTRSPPPIWSSPRPARRTSF